MNKRLFILICFFAASAFMLPCSSQDELPGKKRLIPDTGTTWWQLMRLALEAADSHDDEKSQNLYYSSFVVAEKSGNWEQLRQSLDNLGWASVQVSDFKRAEGAYKRLIEHLHHSKGMNTSKLLVSAPESLANTYRLDGKYLEAENSYLELIVLGARNQYATKSRSSITQKLL